MYGMFSRFLGVFPLVVALLSPVCAQASASDPWTWREPVPQGITLAGIATSASDSVVAVGELGTVLVKPSGGEWATTSQAAGGEDLYDCIWWNGRYYALAGGRVWTSETGMAWEVSAGPTRATQLAAGDSAVVAMESDGVWVNTNSNGQGWAPASALDPAGQPYQSIAGNAGTFVVVGRGGMILTSGNNGGVWTKRESGTTTNLFAVAFGNSTFVAVGAASGTTPGTILRSSLRSSDGITWQAGTLPGTNVYLRSLHYMAGRFLGEGNAGYLESTDGLTWASATNLPRGFYSLASASLSNGEAVVAGTRGQVFTRTLAGAWVPEFSPALKGSYLWPPMFSAACVGNTVVAKDDFSEPVALYCSEDAGVTWEDVASPGRFFRRLSGLTRIGNEIVGFSSGDGASDPPTSQGFYSTTDGMEWNLKSEMDVEFEGNAIVTSIASNSDASVILAIVHDPVLSADLSSVSVRRTVYRSSNWGPWTKVAFKGFDKPAPLGASVETVQWDGNQFVMVLHPGRVLLSADGTKWTQLRALPSDNAAKLQQYSPSGAPAANAAVSVASNGTSLMVRSAKLDPTDVFGGRGFWWNGRERFFQLINGNWVERSVEVNSQPEDNAWLPIYWDGSSFLAPVRGGILVSSTGSKWEIQNTGSSLRKVVFSPNEYVGFTSEMAVQTREANQKQTNALPSTTVSPNNLIVESAGGSQNVDVTSTEASWTATSSASWLTVAPLSGVGNATIQVSVQSGGTLKAPRSATVQVGEDFLTVTQKPATALPVIAIPASGKSASIPFAGDWSGVSNNPAVVFSSTGVSIGNGNKAVGIQVAANTGPGDRRMSVEVNGIEYKIVQFGSLVRKASPFVGPVYTLKLGVIDPAFDPADVDTVLGSVGFTCSPPSLKAPYGSYSATLSIFNGTSVVAYKGKGLIDEDGRIVSAQWAGAKGSPPAVVDLTAQPDSIGNPAAFEGTVEIGGTTYRARIAAGVLSPVPAALLGKHSLLLRDAGSQEFGTGYGALSVDVKGIGKAVGRLANGATWTMSAPVWNQEVPGSEGVFPIFASILNGTGFLGGLVTQAVPGDRWEGPGVWNAPSPVDQTNLQLVMSRYVPSTKTTVPLNWQPGGVFEIIVPDIVYDFLGEVTLTPPSGVVVVMNNVGNTTKAKINPATGVFEGTLTFLPAVPGFVTETVTAKFYGIANQANNQIEGFCQFFGNTGIQVPSALMEVTAP